MVFSDVTEDAFALAVGAVSADGRDLGAALGHRLHQEAT